MKHVIVKLITNTILLNFSHAVVANKLCGMTLIKINLSRRHYKKQKETSFQK
jgi:hypothetical protein